MNWLRRLALIGLLVAVAQVAAGTPAIELPPSGLAAGQLAIVVNARDPLSGQIADYYRRRHGISADRVHYLSFDPNVSRLHPGEFAVLKKQLDNALGPEVQALLLAWAQPYRVGCMSITAAFSLGFDRRYCASGCVATATHGYTRSGSTQPFSDFAIRPSMMLAAATLEQAQALIDRGAAAQGSALTGPRPAAYLVRTPDRARSVRSVYFADVAQQYGEDLAVKVLRQPSIEGRQNILFYFTGARVVDAIDSNRYLPGAMADHLTSSGGKLTDSAQMSAMRWLEAGATGSYGTVVEPCNMLAKFPNPLRAIGHYLRGASLLESYWKSVDMPGQGVFIGDPLAAPFRGHRLQQLASGLLLESPQLAPGLYRVLAADSANDRYVEVQRQVLVSRWSRGILLKPPYRARYRIERMPER